MLLISVPLLLAQQLTCVLGQYSVLNL
jgi:hypothetical protein